MYIFYYNNFLLKFSNLYKNPSIISFSDLSKLSVKYFVFCEFDLLITSAEDILPTEFRSENVYTSYTLNNKKIYWGLPKNMLNKLFSTLGSKIDIVTIYPFFILKRHKKFRKETFLVSAFSRVYMFYKGIPLYFTHKKYFSHKKFKQRFESDFELTFPSDINLYHFGEI